MPNRPRRMSAKERLAHLLSYTKGKKRGPKPEYISDMDHLVENNRTKPKITLPELNFMKKPYLPDDDT